MYIKELFDSILVFLIAFLLAGVILLPVEKLGIAEKIFARFGWSKRKVERWLMLMALALGMLGAFGICAVAYIYFDINLFLAPWAKEYDAQTDPYTTRNKIIYIALLLSLVGIVTVFLRSSKKDENAVSKKNVADINQGLLDGKRFLFLPHDAQTEDFAWSEFPHSLGLFYLLCNQLGSNIIAVNNNCGGCGLWELLCGKDPLTGNRSPKVNQNFFDYIVFLSDTKQILKKSLSFYRNNPNTKIVIVELEGNHDTLEKLECFDALDRSDVVVVDLGRIISNMISDTAHLNNDALAYTYSSFFNKYGVPNYLTAYIASIMIYCALTDTKAVDISATMFQDYSTLISMESHLAKGYDDPDSETNCGTILTTQSELEKIHKLIDQYAHHEG